MIQTIQKSHPTSSQDISKKQQGDSNAPPDIQIALGFDANVSKSHTVYAITVLLPCNNLYDLHYNLTIKDRSPFSREGQVTESVLPARLKLHLLASALMEGGFRVGETV